MTDDEMKKLLGDYRQGQANRQSYEYLKQQEKKADELAAATADRILRAVEEASKVIQGGDGDTYRHRLTAAKKEANVVEVRDMPWTTRHLIEMREARLIFTVAAPGVLVSVVGFGFARRPGTSYGSSHTLDEMDDAKVKSVVYRMVAESLGMLERS